MPTTQQKNTETMTAVRPPVVVIVGHIDHGKTTLLDYIRKTKVAERETGGITQAIGAYQVEHHGRRIALIDTPGHEAFSAMRRRGTHVADVAVLVVAADEGVKPQTEEAIRVIQEAELPFVVAINKADKPNADPQRVKQELAERAVLVEGYGGTVPATEVSAKTGQGVDALLETILLLAELEELTADLTKPGEGVVIESHLDPKRGATATLLVEDGTLRRGEFVAIGDQAAPVRIFENFRGEAVEAAYPSDPVRIAGFGRVPELGERFRSFKTRAEAEAALGGARPLPAAPAAAADAGKTTISIVLKTDVLGSKEAIETALAAVASPTLGHRILKSETGDITESDVKLAASSVGTFIVGFRVKIAPAIRELAERSRVPIVIRDVIYELLDAVKETMIALAPAEMRRRELGTAAILARFREDRGKQIVGGRVEAGALTKGARFEIVRNQAKVGMGKIIGLQSSHRDVEEVPEGQEFGLLAEADLAIAVGDRLECFIEEKVSPTL